MGQTTRSTDERGTESEGRAYTEWGNDWKERLEPDVNQSPKPPSMFGKGGQGTAATLIPASILSHQDDWGGDRTPSTAALTRVQSAVRNGSVYESDVIRSLEHSGMSDCT